MAVRSHPLRAYILALAAATTVPALLLTAFVSIRWIESERFRLETGAREVVDQAGAHLDRFLAGKVAMLQALATSPAIDSGDFRKFDQQARELLDLQGVNIVVRRADGQQVVNTRAPWGTPLPRISNLDADRIVIGERRAVVTDLYQGTFSGSPLIRIIAPVIRDGAVAYTLTASLPPAAVGLLLREARIPAPYEASIVGKGGIVIGRSGNATAFGDAMAGFAGFTGESGVLTVTTPDGREVYDAYRRSPVSGWLVVVGIDRTILDAALERSLLAFLLLAAALALIALGLSQGVARRIISAERQLRTAAEALGNGELIAAPQTAIRETNRVGEALADASSRLHDQAEALLAANRDLERRVEDRTRELSAQSELIRVTLENMDQGLLLLDADGFVPLYNQRALELLDLPEEATARQPNLAEALSRRIREDEFGQLGPDTLPADMAVLEPAPPTYQRELPNGTVLEVRTVPLPGGGAVRTYTDVTALKRSERESHRMARHDELTDLPNRTLFREELTSRFADQDRSGSAFALLCLDLDRFKAVNDTLGHPAGDRLLRMAAERIRSVIPDRALVARLGGDEFAVIQMDVETPAPAEALAQRLLACMDPPFAIDGQALCVGVSIGIATAPRDGRDGDVLFKNADLALYRAKQEGRNGYRFFDDAMDEAQQRRHALGLDLQQALDRQEFELHYQPVVGIRDHAIVAFEALVRWRHPERGLLGPAEFIPLCEEMRLVIPLGSWVLKEACREAASWPNDVRVAVNISALHVAHPGLVPSVIAALGASGLAPHRLEIEITETVLVPDSEPALRILQTLRDFGVRIALDDFGTGHSSLAYLQRFPLDAIKIDRSFVAGRDERSGAIVAAMAALGQGLAMSVMAEGVETTAQLDHVRRAGCTEVQGFLFGAAMPAAEAAELLRVRERVRLA